LHGQQSHANTPATRRQIPAEGDRRGAETVVRDRRRGSAARRIPAVAGTGGPEAEPVKPREPAASSIGDDAFKSQLVALIPHLRAFAFSLTIRPEGEDLAQETMIKAWRARASYQAGTNLKAWLFTILRNEHYSRARRSWRTVALDPTVAENTLVAGDDPSMSEELLDVRNAMQQLSFDQRQALVLVTAAGLSYLETAAICSCAVGTVKSRVNRARAELVAILERQKNQKRVHTGLAASMAFGAIMTEAAEMQSANA
jgi:RNA polymerase sigma-70 factor (ECF subfamily)